MPYPLSSLGQLSSTNRAATASVRALTNWLNGVSRNDPTADAGATESLVAPHPSTTASRASATAPRATNGTALRTPSRFTTPIRHSTPAATTRTVSGMT